MFYLFVLFLLTRSSWGYQQKWTNTHFCEWEGIAAHKGYVCGKHYEWVCMQAPVKAPCLRVEGSIFTSQLHEPFSVSCVLQGQKREMCKHRDYAVDNKCVFKHDFLPTEADLVMNCTFDAPKATCISWDHMFFNFCDEDIYTPEGELIPRFRRRRPFLDYDQPWIQNHINAHMEDFAVYRPHHRHPLFYEQKHVNTKSFTGARGQEQVNDDDTGQEHDDDTGQEYDDDADKIAEAEIEMLFQPYTSTNVYHWPTEGRKRQVFMDPHNPKKMHHVHTLKPHDAPSSFKHDFLPGRKYITDYHEDAFPVMKLAKRGGRYVSDFSYTETLNVNSAARRHHHPTEYEDVNKRHQEIEDIRLTKRTHKLMVLGSDPDAKEYHLV